tara:strand:- start:181 stop:366 length:186 start_codon:yes stop_codon:yes gene_type:complete
MKKALLTLLFVFSATIVGCGGGNDAGTTEGDPAMDDAGSAMDTDTTADPGGEGEDTTNATS